MNSCIVFSIGAFICFVLAIATKQHCHLVGWIVLQAMAVVFISL